MDGDIKIQEKMRQKNNCFFFLSISLIFCGSITFYFIFFGILAFRHKLSYDDSSRLRGIHEKPADLMNGKTLKDNPGLYSALGYSEEIKMKWKYRIQSINERIKSTNNNNLHVLPYTLTEPAGCTFFRTAIQFSSDTFVMTRLANPKCNLKNQSQWVSPICSTDAAITKSCTCQEFQPRVICTIETNEKFSTIYLNSNAISVPVERKETFVAALRPSSVHLCVHGVLYPDSSREGGNYLHELTDLFISHYSKYEISDIHIYTNSSSFLEKIPQFKSTGSSNIWFHETLFPPVNKEFNDGLLTGQDKKSQFFVNSDCYVRAVSAGGKYVIMLDIDELIYGPAALPTAVNPSGRSQSILEIFEKEFATPEALSPLTKPLAIWLPSYMFHTHYCSKGRNDLTSFKSRIASMNIARLDSGTFAGRRKAIYTVPEDRLSLVKFVFPAVHTVDHYLKDYNKHQTTVTQSLHIHHYREPHHDNVCSKNPRVDVIDETLGWQIHEGCRVI